MVRSNAVSIDKPSTNIAAQIDRFGYLDTRYREAKPWLDEREKLKASIQAHYQAEPADEPVRGAGTLYWVDLTAREKQRKITSKAAAFLALRHAMGLAALQQALSYTLKLIDEWIPAEKQGSFVTEARTGPRDIRVVLKVSPEAA